jgi:uncharacterized Fe-S cluster-containing radical SAM superfamily protein
MMSKKSLDTYAQKMRLKGLDLANEKLLIANIQDSSQSQDLTLSSNCNGFGRIRHFKKQTHNLFPENPLPIDPACRALKLSETNSIKAQVFQNLVCSWRCWYCFVDYKLLSGNQKYGEFKSTDELLDSFLKEELDISVIDLSGGQPDLIPEWAVWFLKSLEKRGMEKDIYLWSDDNLSNDYLWNNLSNNDIEKLTDHSKYGRVGCFKGFDENSFSFNTKSDSEQFLYQFEVMDRLVNTGIDMYGYVTLTTTCGKDMRSKMERFVDLLQDIHPNFPLRVIPLEIVEFTPTSHRIKADHKNSMKLQYEAVSIWNDELKKRFSIEDLNSKIYEHVIR